MTADSTSCNDGAARDMTADMTNVHAAWHTFHQHEALTTRLSNILDEYPPGVGTLREYVQNADDAGASALVLCLDTRASGPGKFSRDPSRFPTPALADYADVPALLVYNDAVFSERDFDSISSIGKSRKRDDTATIGRYGLGFNVSYHLTDLVQFVSRDTVVLFDPHGRSLPEGRLGMRARFTDGLGDKYPGLLEPLLRPLARVAGVARPETASLVDEHGTEEAAESALDFSRPVDGTLFRLPLRTQAQASVSDLSSRAITAEDVRGLLTALCDANLGETLLFTQSLRRIAVCVLEPDGSLSTIGSAAVLDASAEGSPRARERLVGPPRVLKPLDGADLRRSRAALVGISRGAAAVSAAAADDDTGSAHARVAHGVPPHHGSPLSALAPPTLASPLLFELCLRIKAADGTSTVERWLMCGGVHVSDEASLLADALGQPAAWATVALPLHSRPVSGRAFCFLPLPLASGLPCHVNGCFALTSNRRGLWVEDADRQLGDAHHLRKAQWNRLLCTEALPRLYAHALEQLAAAVASDAASGAAALDGASSGPPPLATKLAALLPVRADGHGSLWQALQRQTLRALHSRESRVCVCYGRDESVLRLAPLDAVVVADASLADQSGYSRLRAALSEAGLQVWAAAPGTAAALDASLDRPMRRAEPRTVCGWLGAAVEAASLDWDRALAAELLSYVLGAASEAHHIERDETGKEKGGEGKGEEDEEDEATDETWALLAAAPLVGLCVVPLADGTLGPLHRAGRPNRSDAQRVGKRGEARPTVPQYVVAHDPACAALLSRCPVVILPSVLDEPGFSHLRVLAESDAFNLTPQLDACALLQASVMEHLLMPQWHGRAMVNLREAATAPAATCTAVAALDASSSHASDAADEDAPTPAPRGWQPKGKFSGSKKAGGAKDPRSKRAAATGGKMSFLRGGADDATPSRSAALVPSHAAAAAATLDEDAVAVRLRLLWRLVDAAVASGDRWGGIELTRLDEWPTVLTSNGQLVSVGRARSMHVLRPTAFAGDEVARAAMCRFGVAFSALDAAYLNRRVCSGAERLGAALEFAMTEKRLEGSGAGGASDAADAASSLQLADCLALRRAIFDWCIKATAHGALGDDSGSKDDAYAMAGLDVMDGEDSPTSGHGRTSGLRGERTRREVAVQLPAAVLRKLPIFMALSGQRCVPLRATSSAAAVAMIGTPPGSNQGAYEAATEMDDALQDILGDHLLSYANEEVCIVLAKSSRRPRHSAAPAHCARMIHPNSRLLPCLPSPPHAHTLARTRARTQASQSSNAHASTAFTSCVYGRCVTGADALAPCRLAAVDTRGLCALAVRAPASVCSAPRWCGVRWQRRARSARLAPRGALAAAHGGRTEQQGDPPAQLRARRARAPPERGGRGALAERRAAESSRLCRPDRRTAGAGDARHNKFAADEGRRRQW